MLRKFIGDPSRVFPVEDIQVTEELAYEEQSVAILDCQVRRLCTKDVPSVKIYCFDAYVDKQAMSTGVPNELGAGNTDRAKHVVSVTLVQSIDVGLDIWFSILLSYFLGGFFSDSTEIINKFASMTPLLLIAIIFNISQGILSGVARGWGWQRCAMCINLGTFYFIGMPIACLTAFKFNLHTQGLWIGLICALGCQASGLLLLTLLTRWKKVEGSKNSNRETELLA
ncbi:protein DETOXIFICATION 18-like [Lycium ferocissimum]|uniref:protein DETOXIFICATION 18-like n=1 Tax=Lycium ferocissimum TaxID=112874 RepID=UPI002815EECD|nr:protein DETOXIFICATION 18-like [Lycium ferocissimum]